MTILQPDSLLALLEVNDISIHALRLRNKEEGADSTEDTTGEEDPKGIGNANLFGG